MTTNTKSFRPPQTLSTSPNLVLGFRANSVVEAAGIDRTVRRLMHYIQTPNISTTIQCSRSGPMPDPKWKQFEFLVAKIQSDLAGANARVTPNDKILGKTGTLRQIDISIRSSAGRFEFLVIIDCKDYGRPLDIKDVEEFIGMVQDVGAHKAALVSSNGYPATAKTRAKQAQIDIFTVVDTGDHPWRVDVSVPALYQHATITDIGIRQIVKSQYAAHAQIPSSRNRDF